MSFTLADLKNPQGLERVRHLFSKATFLAHIGVELVDVGPGWAESALIVGPHHSQSEGFVHAGVQATMADHTAGSATGSLVAADEGVLTVEFKVNLLRPAAGERLTCRAEVIRAGKRLMFTEARVTAWRGGESKVVSTFSGTIAVVSLRGES